VAGHVDLYRSPAAGAPLQALVAIPQMRHAVALARALLAARILPSLAFSVGDVHAYLEVGAFSVLVLHLQLEKADPYLLLAGVRRRSAAAILALGSEPLPAWEVRALGCHRYVRDSLPPRAVADEAIRLSRRVHRKVLPMGTRQWGGLWLDPDHREARLHGRPLDLTPIQFSILLALVDAAGTVVTPREVARLVWGQGSGEDSERVMAHIRRIRKRIEPDPARPSFLLTVRGVGFRLADAAHDSLGTPQ
jgi:DNA-binding response OmpR family regulator